MNIRQKMRKPIMKITQTLAAALTLTLALVACTPAAPQLQTPDGQKLEADKSLSGVVTGTAVGSNTKIALFGAFMNISGNRINASNSTIEADITLATAPVQDGKYNFSLPKGPQKAHNATLKVFAFNDANNNNRYDEGELKSAEATMTWVVPVGYQLAFDADGNNVVAGLSGFENFDFKLDN